MKNYNINILLFGLVMSLASCASEYVSDPIDPRLVRYSENGSNVAAAFVGDRIWESRVTSFFGMQSETPALYIHSTEDSVALFLYGRLKNNSDVYERTTIKFVFFNQGLNNGDNPAIWNDRKFTFNQDNVRGWIQFGDEEACEFTSFGQIYFRSVKLSSTNRMIISGTFAFNYTDECGQEYDIHSGRFDYTIDAIYSYFDKL